MCPHALQYRHDGGNYLACGAAKGFDCHEPTDYRDCHFYTSYARKLTVGQALVAFCDRMMGCYQESDLNGTSYGGPLPVPQASASSATKFGPGSPSSKSGRF